MATIIPEPEADSVCTAIQVAAGTNLANVQYYGINWKSDACECSVSDSDSDEEIDTTTATSSTASGNAAIDRVINNTPATTRIYPNLSIQLGIRSFLLLVTAFHLSDGATSTIPNLPGIVLDRLKNKHGETGIDSEISTRFLNDPMVKDMASFMSETEETIVNVALSGPCISYYIYAVCEAFLFFSTTDTEKNDTENYTKWLNELCLLYEIVAFRLGRPSIPWVRLGFVSDNDDKTAFLKKMREEMGHKSPTSKDEIPEIKFYSFGSWMEMLQRQGVFQEIPITVQNKMILLLANISGTAAEVDFITSQRMAPLMSRANRTMAFGDCLIEARMWVARKSFRPQTIAVYIAKMVWEQQQSLDVVKWREKVRETDVVKNLVYGFVKEGKFRTRIDIEQLIKSVIGQAPMVYVKKK